MVPPLFAKRGLGPVHPETSREDAEPASEPSTPLVGAEGDRRPVSGATHPEESMK